MRYTNPRTLLFNVDLCIIFTFFRVCRHLFVPFYRHLRTERILMDKSSAPNYNDTFSQRNGLYLSLSFINAKKTWKVSPFNFRLRRRTRQAGSDTWICTCTFLVSPGCRSWPMPYDAAGTPWLVLKNCDRRLGELQKDAHCCKWIGYDKSPQRLVESGELSDTDE